MKKFISIIMTLCFAVSITLVGTVSTEAKVVKGNCGKNATWSYSSHKLSINGKGAMSNYSKASATPWYKYRDDISDIVISKDITSIGNYAFCNIGLVDEDTKSSYTIKTKIPKGVKSIGTYAFYRCGLEEIGIPSTVTSIGKSAFEKTRLEKVKFTSGLKTIGDKAFFDTPVKNFSLPNSLETVGSDVFCSSWGVGVPYPYRGTGEDLFYDHSLSFGKSIKRIGVCKDYNCLHTPIFNMFDYCYKGYSDVVKNSATKNKAYFVNLNKKTTVSFSKKSISLKCKKTTTCSPTIKNKCGTTYFVSSDESIAIVGKTSGKIKALKTGTTYIFAMNNGATSKITIKVIK